MSDAGSNERSNRHIWSVFLWLIICLALSMPAILSGFTGDDFFFETTLHNNHTMFNYYSFVSKSKDASLLPWWTASPFELDFFRPISSATLYFDFKVMGASPLFAHFHSMAWFVFFFLGAASIIWRILPQKEAMIATGVFALGVYHYLPLGWIAARHAVIGGVFTVWSIRYLWEWLHSQSKGAMITGYGLYLLGLFSSETTLAVPVFIVISILFGDQQWPAKVRRSIPLVAITFAYLLAYKLMGFGATGSTIYIDPFVSPLMYLREAGIRLMLLFGAFVFGTQPMSRYVPGMENLAYLAGGLAILIFMIAVGVSWNRIHATKKKRILLLASIGLVGVLPALSGMVDGRACLVSAIAFASICGYLLRALFSNTHGIQKKVLFRTVGVLLSVGLFGISPLSRLGQSLAINYFGGQAVEKAIASSDLSCDEDAKILQLNGTMTLPYMTPFIIANVRGLSFKNWRFLMDPVSDMRIDRDGENSLTASCLDNGPLLSPLALELFRDSSLESGDTFQQTGMIARVIDEKNGSPTKIQFVLADMGDSNKTCFLSVQDERLVRTKVPSVGDHLVIPSAF